MIISLSIKNYALIEDVRVSLTNGLTIVTGETGAGKSILLGALSLLIGKRADVSSVKDASKKCVVEGEFSIQGYQLANVFKELDLDYDSHTIIRREILPSGKSRAFVNDTPVGLSQLQSLGIYLVDIHSQNDSNTFASQKYQLEVLDALAGNAPILDNYQNVLEVYNQLTETLQQQQKLKEEAIKELDYNTFLFNELTEAKLKNIDQLALESSYETLNNAEEIQESLAHCISLLSQESSGTIDTAKEARSLLYKIANYSPQFKELFERLQSTIIEIEDIYESVDQCLENLEANPEALTAINSILQNLYKLQHKHQVGSVSELIAIEEELSVKIDSTLYLDTKIEAIEKELLTHTNTLLHLSKELHSKRIAIIPNLIEKLQEYLSILGLPEAQFRFDFSTSESFKRFGTDEVQLFFTANKGSSLGILKKVASGGEMSRIMLSVKAVLAKYKKLPTLIFDEIDTGVSGEIALKMASIMNSMSQYMQLVSITHLPQVAAKGGQHIKVYKEVTDNTTVTYLKQLNDEERIVEIAQMIGGKNITNTTLANAKELLN